MYSTPSNLWTFTWCVHFELPFRLKGTDKIHTEGFSKFHSNIYSILFGSIVLLCYLLYFFSAVFPTIPTIDCHNMIGKEEIYNYIRCAFSSFIKSANTQESLQWSYTDNMKKSTCSKNVSIKAKNLWVFCKKRNCQKKKLSKQTTFSLTFLNQIQVLNVVDY